MHVLVKLIHLVVMQWPSPTSVSFDNSFGCPRMEVLMCLIVLSKCICPCLSVPEGGCHTKVSNACDTFSFLREMSQLASCYLVASASVGQKIRNTHDSCCHKVNVHAMVKCASKGRQRHLTINNMTLERL